MRRLALTAILLPLAGCGMVDMGGGLDRHAVEDCARLHPAPRQANIERLGVIPVYVGGQGDVSDPAVKAWFAEMDKCTANYQAKK